MKSILLIIILFVIFSCGPRTGTHPENDPVLVPKIDICVVESITLSGGNYQIFIIHMKNKRKTYDIKTQVLNFNIGDSVIVVDETIIMKKK